MQRVASDTSVVIYGTDFVTKVGLCSVTLIQCICCRGAIYRGLPLVHESPIL